jgi:hypothetical protein
MKEDFDDILKRKWEEQRFPVDDDHRQQMIALLDGKKRKRIIPFWWLGGLGLSALVAGYFMVNSRETPSAGLNKPAFESMEIKPSGNDVFTTESQPHQAAENQSSKVVRNESSITSPVVPDASNSSIKKKSSSTKPVLTNAKTSGKQSARPKVDASIKAQPMTSVEPAAGAEPKGVGATPENIFKVDDDAARSYQIVSKAAAVTIEPETRDYIRVEDIMLPDFTGIQYATEGLPVQITPNTSFKNTFYLFGETGVGMILASKPDFSSGWKFRAGGGLGYKLSPRVQFSLSLGYLLQSGGFDFQRTSTVDYAGFGTRSSFNTLTPDKLHYVYSRLGAQYRMRRHIIGVHGGFQYLYGSQGELVTQVHDQFASGVTETSEHAWLVTDGLRKMNWTADLSYGYQLTPRLFATAGADFYFSSITIEDEALAQDGYYWNGAYAPVHPFITLNYLIYAGR